jgi:hypothetical protein
MVWMIGLSWIPAITQGTGHLGIPVPEKEEVGATIKKPAIKTSVTKPSVT